MTGHGSRFDRLRQPFTVDRAAGAADLAVKFAAIVLALGAVLVFFFGPNVELTVDHQVFIDEPVLRDSYARAPEAAVPPVVAQVVHQYNDANERDLRAGVEQTETRYSARRLCTTMPSEVEALFPRTNCKADEPRIGRGHLWERLLLFQNHRAAREGDADIPPLDAAGMQTALARLQDAQFLRARVSIENTGQARARDVVVRVPEGFNAPGEESITAPVNLSPGDAPEIREYRTDTGSSEAALGRAANRDRLGAPISRFAVDWERDEGDQSRLLVWVAVAFFALWLLIVVNDGRLRARRAAGEAGRRSETQRSSMNG